MKQVININFQGRVVPIEVTAFEILKNYTESLSRHFAAEEGKEEIINDIENRIGELFQERLKEGATCITEDDVNAVIKSMGRPEEFDAEQSDTSASTADAGRSGQASSDAFAASLKPRRLYRDETHKVIGGVCSGLANYFGIDVVVVRVIFVILAFAGGLSFIPYIILWVAVPSTASTEIGSTRRKLYRDPDGKLIAGVCSGIGNYFGISAWIPRVLFLIPLITVVFNSHDFSNIFRLGFSPGSLLIYIILWLVIPEASTTAEKLEMKGEKVDISSIKNSVMEEMKGVQERAQKLGREAKDAAQQGGKTFGAEMSSVTKRGSRSLGDIIVFLFKIFAYFIIGCIGIAFVVALFGFGIAAIGLFPMKDFVLNDGWQNAFAWGTLLFFIATPIVGIITWIIRRVAKVRTNSRPMRFIFFGLWIIGVICFAGLIASVGRDFKTTNTLKEENIAIANPLVNRLEVTSNSPDQKFYRNRWFRMEPFSDLDEDTALVQNISVHIVKSLNDSFRVTMLRMSNGPSRSEANRLASLINFNVQQQDSLLVIDKGIAINRHDKFRNQHIVMTIYVPVGKQIRIDRSVGWSHNLSFGPWGDNWDIDFDDLEQWNTDEDYIMRADGLYTLEGEPADNSRSRSRRNTIEIDENGRVTTTGEGSDYRYDSSAPVIKMDSMRQKIRMEQDRIKDSLQRAKDKIEKELQKIGDNARPHESTAMMNSFPAYNPLVIMN